MSTTYKDPYKILDSGTFKRFAKEAETSIKKGNVTHTLGYYIEKQVASSFWGGIGLSGFTLYPTIMNLLGNRELKKVSKSFLKYQFERIASGYNIQDEIAANICIFSIIGYEMTEYKINEQTLSLVPKFLIRSVSKFSVSSARKSVIKEMDEAEYSTLKFAILSSASLLCYYYETIGYIDTFCKNSIVELTDALRRNIDILHFTTFNMRNILGGFNSIKIIEGLNSHSFQTYIKDIQDPDIKEKIGMLLKRNSDKIKHDSKEFCESYLYKEQIAKGISYDKNVEYLKNAYFRYICPSYQFLLDCCGQYYDEMMHLNVDSSKWFNINEFDHQLIYLLSAWLKENRDYKWIKEKNKSDLAEDITNYILSYLRENNL